MPGHDDSAFLPSSVFVFCFVFMSLSNTGPSSSTSSLNSQKSDPNLVFTASFGGHFHAGWLDHLLGGDLWAVTSLLNRLVRIQASRQACCVSLSGMLSAASKAISKYKEPKHYEIIFLPEQEAGRWWF